MTERIVGFIPAPAKTYALNINLEEDGQKVIYLEPILFWGASEHRVRRTNELFYGTQSYGLDCELTHTDRYLLPDGVVYDPWGGEAPCTLEAYAESINAQIYGAELYTKKPESTKNDEPFCINLKLNFSMD
jgi:hypothetical protein